MTPDTRFNVASANKMLTAVAIAQLHEAGRLHFDDPIGRHLPGLPHAFSSRTVRQVLSHSAGFGEILKPGNRAALNAARTSVELLPLAFADEPGPTGVFKYSNAGYIVLGAIVERLSGRSYEEYLGQHVFPIADMQRSGLVPATGDAEGLVREDVGGEFRVSEHTKRSGSSAGGAYMPAGDMYRFAQALLAGRLVSRTTLAEMLRPHVVVRPATAERPGTAWGLGFGLSGEGTDLMFGHNGGAPGIDVFVRLVPASGRVAIVFANRDPEHSSRLSRELLAVGP